LQDLLSSAVQTLLDELVVTVSRLVNRIELLQRVCLVSMMDIDNWHISVPVSATMDHRCSNRWF
jgi:hypothetical protein